MIDKWAISGFHARIDGFHFGFQKMSDKVKDEQVLSLIWCLEALSLKSRGQNHKV